MGTVQSGIEDIRKGLALHRVWLALAHEDIGDQHRRTTLGPIWLLFNYLAYAGTFLVVFDRGATSGYAAYVALGLLVWLYISEVITHSVTLFVRETGFITGTTLPLTVYVMRMTSQSVIRAGYALVGCIGILLASGTPITMGWLWATGGLLLIIVVSPAVILLAATAGAFFPDLQFFVQNLMRLGLFLTPIFWMKAGGGLRGALYHVNPFTYFLEIVRVPVMNGFMPIHAILFCLGLSVVMWCAAIVVLGRARRQIAFLV